MRHNVITDLKSGFFISLIALPLCLGIALASSCPPIAGVITAIVGGLIVSTIGGCHLSIKGPAAGLIVIVLAAVNDLGAGDPVLGYKRMLAVAVVAACLQIILALLRAARFGKLMPPSVIHGMLAAIGVIILAKQIHILLGVNPLGKTPFALLYEIPASVLSVNPELAVIGAITLFLMIILPFIPSRMLKAIPPALFALLVVIPLGLYWHLDKTHIYQLFGHDYVVGPTYLVNLPDQLFSSLVFPDFTILTNVAAYKYVLMLALVGSVESVLTVIAVDSISKAKSDLNRDLFAVGVGNLIAALIGGLPMISEVVRSKANIDSGAKGRFANFFHGAFLLLFVSMLASIIKEIPLAALAAMLMVTGFRLASPRQFIHVRQIGFDQLLMFSITLIGTLATDLLIGILAGCACKIILHLVRGAKIHQLFTSSVEIEEKNQCVRISIFGAAIFTNYLSLQYKLENLLCSAQQVIVDFSHATLIDHTTLSCLESLKNSYGEEKLIFFGLDKLDRTSDHDLSTHRLA